MRNRHESSVRDGTRLKILARGIQSRKGDWGYLCVSKNWRCKCLCSGHELCSQKERRGKFGAKLRFLLFFKKKGGTEGKRAGSVWNDLKQTVTCESTDLHGFKLLPYKITGALQAIKCWLSRLCNIQIALHTDLCHSCTNRTSEVDAIFSQVTDYLKGSTDWWFFGSWSRVVGFMTSWLKNKAHKKGEQKHLFMHLSTLPCPSLLAVGYLLIGRLLVQSLAAPVSIPNILEQDAKLLSDR